MSSQIENTAAAVAIAQSGIVGTKVILPVVANRITTTANMANVAYTIAAQPLNPCLLSVANTVVTTADTMGIITFVGTDINGAAQTEVVIPVADSTVYTTKEFATVTSATGSGWVIGGATADTIVIGVASTIAGTGYFFSTIQVFAAAVVASQTAKPGMNVANMTKITSIPVGTYPVNVTAIALTSGQAIGILARL